MPTDLPINEMKVLRSTVRDQAVEKLRSAIIGGHLRPGERLIEKELCDVMGVSRTSIREALRLLEGEKLIHARPHKGPCVAVPSLDQAKQIYEVRAGLERLAGSRAAKHATEDEIARLNDAVEAFAHAVRRRELTKLVALANQFYEILFGAARNQIALEILRSLNARISFLRATSMSAPGRAPQSLVEMRTIAKAIERRDPEAAGAACAKHVELAAAAGLAQLGRQSLYRLRRLSSKAKRSSPVKGLKFP